MNLHDKTLIESKISAAIYLTERVRECVRDAWHVMAAQTGEDEVGATVFEYVEFEKIAATNERTRSLLLAVEKDLKKRIIIKGENHVHTETGT